MRARITYAAAALGALAALAACSGQEKAASTPQAAAPATFIIHAKDFSYEAPDSVAAGYVAFTLVNDGPGFHHATIFRLDSGKTMTDLTAALKNPGPPPAWAVPVGGPNAPDPGGTTNATLNLTPGNYAILCMVNVPGGVPHFMKGMTHAFTAVASGGSAEGAGSAPTADIDVAMADYGFKFSKPLTAGHHVFEVTNNGPQMHEIEIIKLDSGKTANDFATWIMNPQGPPPAHAVGGVAPEAPGRTGYFSADFTAGNYVAMCFLPDAKDGKPHFMHGMELALKVD